MSQHGSLGRLHPYKMTRVLSLLHVPYLQVGNQPLEHIEELISVPRESFDLVLVSGNITQDGKPSQFETAHRLFSELLVGLHLPPSRLLVVPGMGDVNLLACDAFFRQCDAEERTPQPPYWPKLAPFARFLKTLYVDVPSYSFSEAQPFTLFELPDLNIAVAGINAVYGTSHLVHQAELGNKQIEFFADRLLDCQRRGLHCIGLLGASLNALLGTAPGSRNLLPSDQEALRRDVMPLIDLVVHAEQESQHSRNEGRLRLQRAQLLAPRHGLAASLRPEHPRDEVLRAIQTELMETGIGVSSDIGTITNALQRLSKLGDLSDDICQAFLQRLFDLIEHALKTAYVIPGVYEEIANFSKGVGYALGTEYLDWLTIEESARPLHEGDGLLGALLHFGARWPEPERWVELARRGYAIEFSVVALPRALCLQVLRENIQRIEGDRFKIDEARQLLWLAAMAGNVTKGDLDELRGLLPPVPVSEHVPARAFELAGWGAGLVAQSESTTSEPSEGIPFWQNASDDGSFSLTPEAGAKQHEATLAKLADLSVEVDELLVKGPSKGKVADLVAETASPIGLLVRLATTAGPTALAINATSYLAALAGPGESGAAARLALFHLLHSPAAEVVRLFAAEDIGRPAVPILIELAEQAQDAEVRNRAAADVQSLRLRRALWQVGRRRLRRGMVLLSGERVGLLEETPGGSRFSYDALWLLRHDATAISLTLPLRDAPYESPGLHPFFDNLLPEGWLLDRVCRREKLPPEDRFGMLLLACADCVGAVEIRPLAENEP